MDAIQYTDLYELKFLSDLNLSPDGAFASFAVHRADPDTNKYHSELWLLDTASRQQRLLAARGDAKGAVWLDEGHLLFTSSRDMAEASQPASQLAPQPASQLAPQLGGKETSSTDKGCKSDTGKPKDETVIWRISVHGGEAEPFLQIPVKGASVLPLGGDRFLVSASHKAGEPLPGQACEAAKNEEASVGQASPLAAREGEDYQIFDELPFWFNGRGVVNKLRNTLFLFDRTSGVLTPITEEYFQVSEFALSPDGNQVLFSGVAYGMPGGPDLCPKENALYLYDIPSAATRLLASEPGTSFESPAFFDGSHIFYETYTFEFVGRSPKYHISSLADGSSQAFFADAAAVGTVGTDAAYGGGRTLRTWKGSLYFLQTVWSHTRLVRLDQDGAFSVVNDEPGAIRCFDVAEDGIYLIALRDTQPAGLYFQVFQTFQAGQGQLPQQDQLPQPVLLTDPTPAGYSPGRGRALAAAEIRLDTFNKDYCASHAILRPEYFTYLGRGGFEMEGFVIRPAGFEPGRTYPGILEMHGGPKVAFGDLFHHEMQCLAHMGFFVFYTNPRGSDGRGEKFADITGQLGGIDFEDFMEFTDEVLKRYPELNPERIGICGGSYGGFMCNWMVGHTDRFAAAASQRSISNYFTKGLCTDIGFSHNMAQLCATPWSDPKTVWAHSPLAKAPAAKTPTLFIQSDEDYRCWMSDAAQMYSALRRNGTDTRMVLFHGENHELSRSGKPKNRITRLREIGGWFEKYLKK